MMRDPAPGAPMASSQDFVDFSRDPFEWGLDISTRKMFRACGLDSGEMAFEALPLPKKKRKKST